MSLPPMAWIILALGLLWLGLRLFSRKAEEKRAEAREARMAELLAERDRLLGKKEEPAAPRESDVTSDAKPPTLLPSGEKRCLACKTVNPADATTCSGCGLEL